MYQMMCMLTLGYQAFNSMAGYYLKIVLAPKALFTWKNNVFEMINMFIISKGQNAVKVHWLWIVVLFYYELQVMNDS